MKTNKIPKNIFVLKIANLSRPFETLYEKIWVMNKTEIVKIIRNSYEKFPVAVVKIMNQKIKPAVTAIDLKRGEDSCNFKLGK